MACFYEPDVQPAAFKNILYYCYGAHKSIIINLNTVFMTGYAADK